MLDYGFLQSTSRAVTNDLQIFSELAVIPHLAAWGLVLAPIQVSLPRLVSSSRQLLLLTGPAHQTLHQQVCWRAISNALIDSSGWTIITVGPLEQAAGMSYRRPPAIGSLLCHLLIRQKLAQPAATVA